MKKSFRYGFFYDDGFVEGEVWCEGFGDEEDKVSWDWML